MRPWSQLKNLRVIDLSWGETFWFAFGLGAFIGGLVWIPFGAWLVSP